MPRSWQRGAVKPSFPRLPMGRDDCELKPWVGINKPQRLCEILCTFSQLHVLDGQFHPRKEGASAVRHLPCGPTVSLRCSLQEWCPLVCHRVSEQRNVVGATSARADVAIFVVGKYVSCPVAMLPARIGRTHLDEQFSNTSVVSPGPTVVIFDSIADKCEGGSS